MEFRRVLFRSFSQVLNRQKYPLHALFATPNRMKKTLRGKQRRTASLAVVFGNAYSPTFSNSSFFKPYCLSKFKDDRKIVVEERSVSVGVNLGGRRIFKTKHRNRMIVIR